MAQHHPTGHRRRAVVDRAFVAIGPARSAAARSARHHAVSVALMDAGTNARVDAWNVFISWQR